MGFAVVTDQGELNLLKAGMGALDLLQFHLYDNDVTPGQTSVRGDFNVASFAGYAGQTVDRTAIVEVSGKAELGDQTFTFPGPTSGGPVDIYGWFCLMQWAGTEYILSAGRFSGAPRTLTDDTDTVSVVFNFRAFDAHQP